MKVKILKDTTLTVKSGQIVNIDETEAPLLIKLGRVEKVKPPAKKNTSEKASE